LTRSRDLTRSMGDRAGLAAPKTTSAIFTSRPGDRARRPAATPRPSPAPRRRRRHAGRDRANQHRPVCRRAATTWRVLPLAVPRARPARSCAAELTAAAGADVGGFGSRLSARGFAGEVAGHRASRVPGSVAHGGNAAQPQLAALGAGRARPTLQRAGRPADAAQLTDRALLAAQQASRPRIVVSAGVQQSPAWRSNGARRLPHCRTIAVRWRVSNRSARHTGRIPRRQNRPTG